MDIAAFVTFLSTAQDRIRSSVSVQLNDAANTIRNELRSKAPVTSGAFRESWRIETSKTSGNITSVGVFNRRVYAPVIELGSTEGELPWPSVETRKKLVVAKDGRIWSKKAVGGTVEPLFKDERFTQTIVSKVLEAAVRGFNNG